MLMSFWTPEPRIRCRLFDRAAVARELSNPASYLSDDERIRAESMNSDHRRNEFILGRALLRVWLGRETGKDPRALDLRSDSQGDDLGKPYLANPPQPIDFSFSHSAERLFLAVSNEFFIGADIQYMDSSIGIELIAKRLFGASDLERISREQPSRRRAKAFEIWCEREARFKAGRPGDCRADDPTVYNTYSGILAEDYAWAVTVRNH